MRRTVIRFLSVICIAGGLLFIFSGARDFLGSLFGQWTIAHRWSDEAGSRPEPQAVPSPGGLGPALARLVIPRLDLHLFVVEGTDGHDLRVGPGHMTGTAMPGAPGNCVIAGHRDTHFRPLRNIRAGDLIVIQTRYGKFRYEVTGTDIVSPDDTAALQPTGGASLHLITCYPFYYVGPAPKRFVVTARLEGNPVLLSVARKPS